jgi:small-conductance mechanosensitive channel
MIALLSAGLASAAGTGFAPLSIESTAPQVPDDLSEEDVPKLVSRLSDEDVRALLIGYLNTIAVAKEQAENQQDIIGGLQGALTQARERLRLMVSGVPALPSIGPFLVDQMTEGQERSIIWLKLLAVMFFIAGGFAAEWLFRRICARFEEAGSGAGPRTTTNKISSLALILVRDILALVVFGLAATGLFFLFYEGHLQTREVIVTIFWAVIVFRAIAALGRFALAPNEPWLRLPPLDDATAKRTYSRLLQVAGPIVAATNFSALLIRLGLGAESIPSLALVLGSIVLGLIFVLIWIDRDWVRALIEGSASEGGQPPSRFSQAVAANWHILASSMVVFLWVLAMGTLVLTGERAAAPLVLSLAVLVGIPIVNWIIKEILSTLFKVQATKAGPLDTKAVDQDAGAEAADTASPGSTEPAEPPESTEPDGRAHEARVAYCGVIASKLRIVVVVIAIFALARVWKIDVEGLAAWGIGEKVTGALFDIVVTVILASVAWSILKTAIQYAMPDDSEDGEVEGGDAGGSQGSRLHTLVPLFGHFLLGVIMVMAGLTVLSELGVDIGPLIAGAGIFGLAIGFGAQTLVKDVISGVFFLFDDAFRVGEYVNVGSVAGTVEHVSLRSLRLRHQNGPLHTIPFGEIQHLTNYSRDWAIMKLKFRVPFDTDTEKLRKIVKKIGKNMLADPELGPNFLAPLKSQGVLSIDDSAFVMRVKFTAIPGKQFILRREVFRRIQEAFAENGIQFAPRRVIVDTGGGSVSAEAAAAAATAIAEEAAEEGKKK